jgi:hypothetical protein
MYLYRCRYKKSCGRRLNLIKPSVALGLKFEQQTPSDVRSRYFRKAWCMSGISIHLLNYASTVHKAVQFKSKLQHTGTLSAVTWPLSLSPNSILPPTVSLRFHFREKNCARVSKISRFFYSLEKYVHLRLRNSEGVCTARNVRTFNLWNTQMHCSHIVHRDRQHVKN